MSDFDPVASPTTAQDDPLRDWFSQLNDPGMAALMITNPDKAKELMIEQGVAPPPHASAFSDPYGNSIDPTTGMPQSRSGETVVTRPSMGAPGVPTPQPNVLQGPENSIIRTGPDGRISGNITAPSNPDNKVPFGPPPPPGYGQQNPLDPAEPEVAAAPSGVPMPRERPVEAGPGNVKSDKADKAADALSGFSKSLAGVKPVQPPPVNPVGTPAAPHPTAVSAPNVANLLALAGQTAQQRQAMATLGRLLVAGKA